MKARGFEFQSDYAKSLLAQGHAEGLAEVYAENVVRGEIRGVLRILEKRGVTVPDHVRTRLLARTDLAQADTWLDRALTATTVDDLFTEDA